MTTAVHMRATLDNAPPATGDDWRERSFYDSFDGTYGVVNDVVHLTLYVKGDPYRATRETIDRLEDKLVLRIVEIERDLVTISDIAERTGQSKESIRLRVEGKRGCGGFPTPVGASGGVPVWDWTDVNDWLRANDGLGDMEDGLARGTLFALNHWLARRFSSSSDAAS